MTLYRSILSSVTASLMFVTLAAAQTNPQPDSTAPSAASSPHQRDATSSKTPEAPTGNGSNPAAASSPHQKQVASGTGKSATHQTQKACVARQQADHSGMSATDAQKACKAQLKTAPPK